MAGHSNIVEIEDISVDDTHLPPGYGRMNKNVFEALRMSAFEKGIILDPNYSGGALAGLIQLTRNGIIASGQNVLFIHTGGVPANFGYHNDLETLMVDA